MRILILVCFVAILVSCRGHRNKHIFSSEDEKFFYTDCNGMDYIRFPLLMPYDVMCINFRGEKNWVTRLNQGFEFHHTINLIKEISVQNNIIFIHSLSEHQIIDGENPKQWFLIIPSKKIELGFLNEAELKSYVEQYNIIKINWIQAQDLYNQFKDSECLPWIPGCSE